MEDRTRFQTQVTKKIKKICQIILEALFPFICASCNKETGGSTYVWCCDECYKTISSSWKTICHICQKDAAFLAPNRCAHEESYLKNVSFIFYYEQPAVRSLIHAIKYKFVTQALEVFKECLVKERLNFARIPADIIVPIPLHKHKLRERGFNQALLIAATIEKIIKKPIVEALQKTRRTNSQMKIKRTASRTQNVFDIFKVADSNIVKGKSILLIDDVLTTGATMEEASRTLIRAGAKKVYGFVLARD